VVVVCIEQCLNRHRRSSLCQQLRRLHRCRPIDLGVRVTLLLRVEFASEELEGLHLSRSHLFRVSGIENHLCFTDSRSFHIPATYVSWVHRQTEYPFARQLHSLPECGVGSAPLVSSPLGKIHQLLCEH